ncbi:Calpain-5 [Manis pentadactyla]|nr:Calpain-5 [Manis pentadactyla]
MALGRGRLCGFQKEKTGALACGGPRGWGEGSWETVWHGTMTQGGVWPVGRCLLDPCFVDGTQIWATLLILVTCCASEPLPASLLSSENVVRPRRWFEARFRIADIRGPQRCRAGAAGCWAAQGTRSLEAAGRLSLASCALLS